jgi:hypothetical protein
MLFKQFGCSLPSDFLEASGKLPDSALIVAPAVDDLGDGEVIVANEFRFDAVLAECLLDEEVIGDGKLGLL